MVHLDRHEPFAETVASFLSLRGIDKARQDGGA